MRGIRAFIEEEDGIGVVEIILILVVLVGLVLLFKDKLEEITNNVWEQIESEAGTIYE